MSSRQQLSQREIDHVLGNYAIGKVHRVFELAQGSAYSPKIIIESDRGKLLLKRRARGLDVPTLVVFSHQVILGCLDQGVCIPPLLGTKSDNNSMVQFEDHTYELFAFIEGTPYDRSPAMIEFHAQQAGALLCELHTALDQIQPSFEPPVEPNTIDTTRLKMLESTVCSQITDDLRSDLSRILGYGDELSKANAQCPALVHGDWHPGNMIYRGKEIVSACDFDNTRVGSRAREVAQALIHFSLKSPTSGQTAFTCDPDPDTKALRAFWNGYCSSTQASAQVSIQACTARLCLGLMPAVMIDEALASLPVGTSTPNEQVNSMLIAVVRKATWIDEHQSELRSLLESTR